MQELWFLCCTRRLMLIVIYMKFREDSLNDFQVIERTRVWQTDRRLEDNNMSPNEHIVWDIVFYNVECGRHNNRANRVRIRMSGG